MLQTTDSENQFVVDILKDLRNEKFSFLYLQTGILKEVPGRDPVLQLEKILR